MLLRFINLKNTVFRTLVDTCTKILINKKNLLGVSPRDDMVPKCSCGTDMLFDGNYDSTLPHMVIYRCPRCKSNKTEMI